MRVSVGPRPLLPLAAVTAGLASTGTLAAEWTLTPSGEISAQSQQNPRLSAEEDQKHVISNGMGAIFSLGLQRSTERTSFTVSPVVRAYRFADDNNLDRDEEHLDLGYHWLGEKTDWRATASASRDTTLTSELGTTGLTQGNLRHESYDLSVGPTWSLTERWQLQSTLESQSDRYPDQASSLSDYRYSTAVVATSYQLNEQTSVSVFGTAGLLDSEGNGDNTDDSSANVQVQYVWSPQSSVNASIGRSWVKSDAGNEQGLRYSLSASHAFEKAALALSVSRRTAPSGRALLTQADEARLTYSTQLTERLSASASGSLSKRRNLLRQFDIDLERVRYTRAELNLSWRMTPNWHFGFSTGYATQQIGSAFLRDDLLGRGYDAHLSVGWNGDPYVR